MFDPLLERSYKKHPVRSLLLITGAACWTFTAGRAVAQDVAEPPGAAKPPAESPPSPPAPEPSAPEPPAPGPSAPPAPAAPSAAPPAPAAPSAAAPVAPATPRVTLEETPEDEPLPLPEEADAPRPKKKPKARRPSAKKAAAEQPPVSEPASTSEPVAEPSAGSAEAPAESEESAEKSKDDEDDGDGLLGPFRIGALVGVGLPSIVSFGGMIKLTRYFGAGLNIGLIPAIKLSLYGEAQLSYQEYDLYGRLFPFGGNLFVGAGVGYATMKGSFRSSYDTAAYQAEAAKFGAVLPNPVYIASEGSVRTLVLTPTIGLLHTFGSGFTVGIDLGAQVPIAPSKTEFQTVLPPSVPSAIVDRYVTPNDKKVQDTLDTVGRTILPTLNLRVGWLI